MRPVMASVSPKMKIHWKPNLFGAVCLSIYAITLLAGRQTSLGVFEICAVIFWLSASMILLRWPRVSGIIVGMFAFAASVARFCHIHSALADFVSDADIQVRPDLWIRFWISVAPLVVGGLFAFLSVRNPSSETADGARP